MQSLNITSTPDYRALLRSYSIFLAVIVFLAIAGQVQAQTHPNLILTKQGVEDIRAQLGNLPVFDDALAKVKAEVDAEMELGILTPVPKDFSGGYTHERHKLNYAFAQKAGLLYQILGDEKYAKYVRDMFFQYADMYVDLPRHPQIRSYARGKLFWQSLNESVWLVFMAQAYDTVYTYLSEEERQDLEQRLFKPVADFISIENPQYFNRVHNHSTWGTAAVGMIGLVMDDDELINRALYGLDDDGIELGTKDDDGGFLKVEGQQAGFIANLEEPFSPEGYFTEGPYYQRYAMYPFLVFSVGVQNARPELNLLAHKDNVLIKAVYSLLNLSDEDGEFFPLNDGQGRMSYLAPELVTAVNMAYYYGNQDPTLLSIAEKQNTVLLDQTGLAVAMAIKNGKAEPYVKPSVNYGDGPNGEQGGISVLRSDSLELVFKYTAQGLSHGHYDKLFYALYDNGTDILQDYGMSRFVNIEKKGGGNYLKENSTWAKQTVAHNTLVQNQKSHFGGEYEVGSQHHSKLYFYDASDENVQVVSATEENAYPGTMMHRTMAVIKDGAFEKPIVLDIFRVESGSQNTYDLPFYYMGQILEATFDYDAPSSLSALGDSHGYQHLYVEGEGSVKESGLSQMTWMQDHNYYTLSLATQNDDELMLTRIGANDPEFNLRRDPGLMLRREKEDTVFVSVVEPHGGYNPVTERSVNANSHVKSITVLATDGDYTAVEILTHEDRKFIFVVSNKDNSKAQAHSLNISGRDIVWTGPYGLFKG